MKSEAQKAKIRGILKSLRSGGTPVTREGEPVEAVGTMADNSPTNEEIDIESDRALTDNEEKKKAMFKKKLLDLLTKKQSYGVVRPPEEEY